MYRLFNQFWFGNRALDLVSVDILATCRLTLSPSRATSAFPSDTSRPSSTPARRFRIPRASRQALRDIVRAMPPRAYAGGHARHRHGNRRARGLSVPRHPQRVQPARPHGTADQPRRASRCRRRRAGGSSGRAGAWRGSRRCSAWTLWRLCRRAVAALARVLRAAGIPAHGRRAVRDAGSAAQPCSSISSPRSRRKAAGDMDGRLCQGRRPGGGSPPPCWLRPSSPSWHSCSASTISAARSAASTTIITSTCCAATCCSTASSRCAISPRPSSAAHGRRSGMRCPRGRSSCGDPTLLSEAYLTVGVLALAAAIVFLVALDLSQRWPVALLATMCVVAAEPKLYNYEKVLMLALAVAVAQLWIVNPSWQRLSLMAIWTASPRLFVTTSACTWRSRACLRFSCAAPARGRRCCGGSRCTSGSPPCCCCRRLSGCRSTRASCLTSRRRWRVYAASPSAPTCHGLLSIRRRGSISAM